MKSFKLIILLSVFILNSCNFYEKISEIIMPTYDHDYFKYKIVNNSDMTIAFCHYTLTMVASEHENDNKYTGLYPDTLLPPEDLKTLCKKIDPMSDCRLGVRMPKETIINRYGENDTLLFFVFSPDTLNKYSWDEIREGYKIIKRYDLRIEDLESMNWTITYP